jgi:hypothetical protein
MVEEGDRSERGWPRSRRSYLKLAGLAATAAGVGGVAWAVEQAGRSQRTVDLADHGIDGGGDEPIDIALADVAADDTTVRLPSGTYRLESFQPGPLSNFTLEGDDATLVPPQGSTGVIVGLLGNHLTLRGFTFDYTAENTAPQVVVRCSDGLVVEDCKFVGVADVPGGQGRSAHEYHLMPAVLHPTGEGVVRNVTLADGTTSPSNRGGIWVSGDSAGRLRFENVHLERWANNSLYVSESDGALAVVGSRFVNNDVGGPRIGAATAEVRDTTVIADGWVPVQAFTGARNSRGLWIDDACETVRVENCEFVMTGPYAGPAIVFQDWSNASSHSGLFPEVARRLAGKTSIDVRNSRFRMRDGLEVVRHASAGATVTTVNLDVRVET